jgi:hypothetical protein
MITNVKEMRMNNIKNLLAHIKHDLKVTKLDDLSYESQIEVARVYFQDHPNKVVIQKKINELLDSVKDLKETKNKKKFKKIFKNQIMGKQVEDEINKMLEEA